MDISQAFADVKGLSDDKLNTELANPSGMIPGYILMSELQDRQALRNSTKMGASKRPSMKEELLASLPKPEPFRPESEVMPQRYTFGASGAGQMPTVTPAPDATNSRQGSPQPMQSDPSRQYSRGGIIAALNPFNTQMEALQDPKLRGGLMQEAMNAQTGGLTSLQPPQAPGSAEAPTHTSQMLPTSPNAPQPIQRTFANGGLASLYGR